MRISLGSKKARNAYAVCQAMKKRHGWGHRKWKRCVSKVKKG